MAELDQFSTVFITILSKNVSIQIVKMFSKFYHMVGLITYLRKWSC